jgi:hypothetical protein
LHQDGSQCWLEEGDVAYETLGDQRLIHLWGTRGNGRIFRFYNPDLEFNNAGLELGAWHAIRDLPPGPATIILATIETFKNTSRFEAAKSAFEGAIHSEVHRDDEGAFQWAVLVEETVTMVDSDIGVIAPRDIGVDELQSSMCTPWQYDFRDCKCYYWAANVRDTLRRLATIEHALLVHYLFAYYSSCSGSASRYSEHCRRGHAR